MPTKGLRAAKRAYIRSIDVLVEDQEKHALQPGKYLRPCMFATSFESFIFGSTCGLMIRTIVGALSRYDVELR